MVQVAGHGADLKIPIADSAEYLARVASRAKVCPKVEADALKIMSKAEKAGIRPVCTRPGSRLRPSIWRR